MCSERGCQPLKNRNRQGSRGADYDKWESDADARDCAKKLGVNVDEGEKATKGHVLRARP